MDVARILHASIWSSERQAAPGQRAEQLDSASETRYNAHVYDAHQS